MACANNTYRSHAAIPIPERVWTLRSAVVILIVELVVAIQEAWKMRRAVRRSYPFSDE